MRHRLTRDMKAKCYKNMSAGAKISSIKVKSNAISVKIAAFRSSCKRTTVHAAGAAESCDILFYLAQRDTGRLQQVAIAIVITHMNHFGVDNQMCKVVLADDLTGEFMSIIACGGAGQRLIEDKG